MFEKLNSNTFKDIKRYIDRVKSREFPLTLMYTKPTTCYNIRENQFKGYPTVNAHPS